MNNVETVKGIYAAFGRQDGAAILAAISEDVDWDYPYGDSKIPWLKHGRGHAAVGRFLQVVGEGSAVEKFEVKAVLGEGRLVLAIIDITMVVRATGKRIVELDEPHVWFFDERGKVCKFRHGADTLQQYEALQR